MRIRTKFSLLVSLPLVLMTIGISSILFVMERRAALSKLRQEQANQARNFAAVCQQAVVISDMVFLINYLKVLKTVPGVEWAYLVDTQDRIRVHSDETFIYQPLAAWSKVVAERDVEELGEPVLVKGELVGRAYLGLSRAHIRRVAQEAVAGALRWVAVAAGGGILLALAVALGLSFFMTRPIRELASGAQRIGEGQLDVSLPVRAEDELGELTRQFNRMAERLKELDELKDEFISTVSHDLRNPLASIKMYVDYLLSEVRGPLSPEQKDMLKICAEAAFRLGIFIETILDSAKIKAGRMDYRFAPFKFSEAVAPVVKLMKLGLDHKRLALSLPQADPPPLRGDRDHIERVMANLLSNAFKHTPDGGQVQVSWTQDLSGQIRITVANTGRGIPPEDLKNLFQKFYQADVATQKKLKIKGTGLGLSLVKQIVEAHGGKVWVESVPGQWTRFHFTLPLATAKGAEVGYEESARRG